MHARLTASCCIAMALSASVSPAFAVKKTPPPPPLCNLLVDPKGDGGGTLHSPALDFTGADVATGKKTVVGVIRVVSTATANDPDVALGATWNLNFSVKGKGYTFQRRRIAGAAAQYQYTLEGAAVPATETATEIRFVAQRSAVPELAKPKQVIDTIALTSQTFVTNGESGSTSKKYPDLAPSCLKPA